ncbi:MAG: hypothetical protein C4K58_02485 [Flavobacteriaceae bacterium]|nr:MAG: hypothetical protein C4K58_02485 [Flavobacteriaceae bacterium]
MKKNIFLLILALGIIFSAYKIWYLSSHAPIALGTVYRDVVYKDSLTLDIYTPTKKNKKKKSPTLVYFHGGAWMAGSKETINFDRVREAANKLRDLGYTVVSVNYSLANNNTSPFPSCLIDARDALEFLEQNKEKYNLDIQNLGVIGESAGGQIALSMAYATQKEFSIDPKKIPIRYIIEIYAPTDLKLLYKENIITRAEASKSLPEPIKETLAKEKRELDSLLMGFDPVVYPNKVDTFSMNYSPIELLKDKKIPTLIIHGDKDRIAPIKHAYLLKNKLDSLEIESSFKIFKGVDHAFAGITESQKKVLISNIVWFCQKYTQDR